jgi:hypothetical protein
MRTKNESGIALISALLILVLLGILLEGFILSVNSEQELIGVDRGQTQSFYGALAGLEKLTADLGALIDANYRPTESQIAQLTEHPPELPYMSFSGSSGFLIEKKGEETRQIHNGPYEGLKGLMTRYVMTSTAQALGHAEVKMRRELQVVMIPVFQFGIFSETDLSFFAGPDFEFGGRVHTNGNLFLAEGGELDDSTPDANDLWLKERVTAHLDVIRTHLSNKTLTDDGYEGNINIRVAGGEPEPLGPNEGSLEGTIGSADNPLWDSVVERYKGNLLNGDKGARRLDLPLVENGAVPIDIIRRPPVNEHISNSLVLDQRFFNKASLRILLSDSADQIKSLPYVTQSEPVQLIGTLAGGMNMGKASSATRFRVDPGTDLIGGFIKIEIQTTPKTWQDVTAEILGFGVSGPEMTGGRCSQYPDSIVRVQRHRDEANPLNCGSDYTNYWPNVLYDTREGILRANISTTQYNVYLGGVMHYVELDVNNLSRWFRGEIGASGPDAMHPTGYVVYFSDRRTNEDGSGNDTGEYGFEDNINRTDAANGYPDGVLEDAEDVNDSRLPPLNQSSPEMYGATRRLPGGAIKPPYDSAYPTRNNSGENDVLTSYARANPAIFFRRALKLLNGSNIQLGTNDDGIREGLTIAAENPVYIQGNYNEDNNNFDDSTDNHVAAAVIADAVTLLSNNWTDIRSFNCPHTMSDPCNGTRAGRKASTTWYRVAIIAGKGKSFDHPGGGRYKDFGTDGGVHNFLRFLENWGGQNLNYRGSIVSLYYNRQATGTYKCGDDGYNNVYSPPTRGYKFDDEFLDPKRLPPETPMFKDINITGFTHLKMPNQ